MAYSFAELRNKSTDDLIREHDNHAKSTVLSLNYYREEILRRETESQSQQMLTLTESMRDMTADIRKWTKIMMLFTGIVTFLTVVNVLILVMS